MRLSLIMAEVWDLGEINYQLSIINVQWIRFLAEAKTFDN